MDKNKNPHEGHRKRVREKFLQDGSLLNYPEHNILEMLLFYSAPRSDTNELAHLLIDRFGSLQGVLNAPHESLTQVKGVGEHTAMLIRLVHELIKKSLADDAAEIKHLRCDDDTINFIRPYFHDARNEQLLMICLNNTGKILHTATISEGAHDFACVDTRKLIQEVIFSNATRVIIAHNHPGGICAPSAADLEVTKQISKILHSINAKLLNHVIITDNDFFSFASHPTTSNALLIHDAEDEDNLKVAEGESN